MTPQEQFDKKREELTVRPTDEAVKQAIRTDLVNELASKQARVNELEATLEARKQELESELQAARESLSASERAVAEYDVAEAPEAPVEG